MNEEKKNRILIVYDDVSELKILSSILGDEYTIYTATVGRDAIKKAKDFKPDLILLDIVMPEMDGFQTLTEIKKNTEIYHIPVIFITNLDSLEDEEKGLDLDAADYIHKPFSDKIVKLRIRNQINIINQIRDLVENHKNLEKKTKIARKAKSASLEKTNRFHKKGVSAASEDSTPKNNAKSAKSKKIKSASEINFIENIRKINEIDIEIGLARASGKEEVFQKILCIFQKKIVPECCNMDAFFNTDDIKNFTNSVLALKTLLATIGAMKLSKAAFELEIAAKKQNNKDCTKQFHKFRDDLLLLDKKLSDILPDA